VTGSDVAQRHTERPVVIAHRGASHVAPENTVAAIGLAAELEAVAVEFDVHQTGDGVPVIIHDHTLMRTTDGRGKVRDKTLAELQDFDAGAWFSAQFAGQKIPSLEEGLVALGDQSVACIEIKSRKNMMDQVQQALRSTGTLERAVIFSFHGSQVRASKAAMPDVPALLLIDPKTASRYSTQSALDATKAARADLVGLDHRAVDRNIVQALQQAGYPVFVYTVDLLPDIERMVDLGVDGIISNRPRATLGHVLRLRPQSK